MGFLCRLGGRDRRGGYCPPTVICMIVFWTVARAAAAELLGQLGRRRDRERTRTKGHVADGNLGHGRRGEGVDHGKRPG